MMYKKGMQTVWITILTLLVTTSACNSSFFKPVGTPVTADTAVVIPARYAANSDLSTTAFIGPPTKESIDKSISSSASAPVDNIPSFETPEVTNLWDRIRTGMQLGDYLNNDRVITHINRYSRHQEYIDQVTDRARPFLHLIMEQIDAKNMPAEIVLLPIVESAFEPFAYSHGRAAGIWQFIPGTGRMYGLKQDWWYDGRRDIVASTNAALAYLESLHKRLDGDWLLALAAYNSGAGNVWRAIRKNRKKGLPTDFWHLDLPDETRAYVPKLLAISAIIANPQRYNITLKPVLNEPHVVEVETASQIDLALVAKLADISIEEVYRLNPAFNHWATTPDKQHKLLIPVEKESLFKEGLAKTPKDQFIQWKRHKIQAGETLSHIAKRYHTTVKLLRQVNNLNGQHIRQGKHLLIPVAQQTLSDYSLTRNQRSAARLSRQGNGQKRIITVANGDTFWDLSRKYKVSVRTLAKWNGMAPADTLKPGKKLVLWTRSNNKAGSSRPHSSNLPADTIRTIHYTVRRGDSLARISNKFKVTVKQLRQWNRLPKGRYLKPGQQLKLYVDVTRQT
jgi:membrane-bound lytic murein transglycosylase D